VGFVEVRNSLILAGKSTPERLWATGGIYSSNKKTAMAKMKMSLVTSTMVWTIIFFLNSK
jgi:hypothetical protein